MVQETQDLPQIVSSRNAPPHKPDAILWKGTSASDPMITDITQSTMTVHIQSKYCTQKVTQFIGWLNPNF